MMDRAPATAPFGDLLRGLRQRVHLTQQGLAQRIGVHRNTISGWQRGDYLPESRAMVLELARHLRLGETDTRRLLEASLTALAPHWTVPMRRNPFFTGREELLERLHMLLCGEHPVALIQSYALTGLGGMGKTQLALEYAYRHALDYSAVFWLAAETPETLLGSLQRIAEVLCLPERQEAEPSRLVAAVQRWLISHRGWLLIADNVEDLELLYDVLPPARQGAVLLTTRLQALGTLAEGLEVPPLSLDEGAALVLRRGRVFHAMNTPAPTPADLAAARKLATLLDGLPLALDQAGAYIEETGCGVADYLARYLWSSQPLLARRGAGATDHPHSVATTILLAVERAEQLHPAAADLLRLCAFFYPEAIPEELLVAGAPHLGPVLGPVAADPAALDLALAALRRFSLVTRQPETHTLSVHRLVQAVLRERLDPADRLLWSERASHAVNAAFPDYVHFSRDQAGSWPQAERCLPHALECIPLLAAAKGCMVVVTELLYKTGYYLFERGRFQQAERLLIHTIPLLTREDEPDDPALAPFLILQALVSWRQGKHGYAESLLHRALALCESHLGPEHPKTASALNELAVVAVQQGKYAQAERFGQRALSIRERQWGPSHPAIADSLTNLAWAYQGQGRFAETEPLLWRALAMWEEHLGQTAPQLTAALDCLAQLAWEQGNYEQVVRAQERALSIREQRFEPDHPALALSMNMLALVYARQGEYKQAEQLAQRALALCEQQFGPDHPRTANSLHSLATCYWGQRRYTEAEVFYQRALAIFERQVQPAPLEMATTLHQLARLAQAQGKQEQADLFYQRALAMLEQRLGPEHPKTRQVRQEAAALIKPGGASDAAGLPTPDRLDKEEQDQPVQQRKIAVSGNAKPGQPRQHAYTRTIQTRLVTFTCAWCGHTVKEQRYPGPRPAYCSTRCEQEARRAQTREQVQRFRARLHEGSPGNANVQKKTP